MKRFNVNLAFFCFVLALGQLKWIEGACDTTCHCDYYDFCVACKTPGQVVNWAGNSGDGACVANAAACPSTVTFNNGGITTCVPTAAKVTDCVAYYAWYNSDDDVYCAKCGNQKAISTDDDGVISCVATADCPDTGKAYQLFDPFSFNTSSVCVDSWDSVVGCASYVYDYVTNDLFCMNCTTSSYVIDYYNWECVHPSACPGDEYWLGAKTYQDYTAPAGSAKWCQWPDYVRYGCTQVNEFGYCVNGNNGLVMQDYMEGYFEECTNCALNLYTYFYFDIYKLPFECSRFMSLDNYSLEGKFTEGLKLAMLTSYSTAAKALKTKKNALVTVFPTTVVPAFAFWPANDGWGYKYTWNKGYPEWMSLSCYTVTDALTSTKYNRLYVETEIDTYIHVSTAPTQTLNQIRNDWFDALVDIQSWQFSVQAFSMMKSVKAAIDTYLGTLGTYTKESERPFVDFYFDSWASPYFDSVDSRDPFYGWFVDTAYDYDY